MRAVIAIVDCDLGNIGSVANMARKVGLDPVVTADPARIDEADAIVLPGVGAFDRGSEALTRLGLRDVLGRRVLDEGTPFLGICLGMQLLAAGSEEGELPGLGWLDARVTKVDAPGLPVPHMGWNHVEAVQPTDLLVGNAPRFYFVHSYRIECADPADVLATTTYGTTFTSAVRCGNVLGVQFHPEKSHAFGMALFEVWATSLVEAR